MANNTYCDVLSITVPTLDAAKEAKRANTYALLIVALLERGEPMTLEQVAERFEQAHVAPAADALESLKRCRPARPPVYRDGDLYALDPYDDDLDLWVFRLGLRPPKVPKLTLVKPEPEPLPDPTVPLTKEELAEAFRDDYLGGNWSAQRLAISVLDAHGSPMPGLRVVASLNQLTTQHVLREKSAAHWGRGAPVRADEDGMWALDKQHPHVLSAREAVRDRIEVSRRYQAIRSTPAEIAAAQRRWEQKRKQHAAELAELRRVIVHTFPAKRPEAAVLLDVGQRELSTFVAAEIEGIDARLADYDVIGALDVRPTLKGLGFNPGKRRLAELGPPQKSRRLNQSGRTLKITTAMLISGSCGISKPLADPKKLRGYLDGGQVTRLRRRLEADAKALFAYYQYGLLQGAVRLRWGFVDEMLLAPWKHSDEIGLYELIREAQETDSEIEIIVGSAPGWAEPWSRAKRCHVIRETQWDSILVGDDGYVVDEREVQAARLVPHS
jgi:hypothetical protein